MGLFSLCPCFGRGASSSHAHHHPNPSSPNGKQYAVSSPAPNKPQPEQHLLTVTPTPTPTTTPGPAGIPPSTNPYAAHVAAVAAPAAAAAAVQQQQQQPLPSPVPAAPSSLSPRVTPSPNALLDIYDRGPKLGSGTFADVYEVTHKETGHRYALKTMRKRKLKGREKVVRREIEVLAALSSHPNVVGLVPGVDAFFDSEDAYHLVMELCTGHELFDSIVERGFYTERDAVSVVAQVLDAVKYCHDLGVVHRDLKPENLLLKDASRNARVMVADFGLSRLAEFDNQMFMTACGTPAYCAPEIILNKGHGKPVDMWSLGCITYVILCGYIPFWAESQREVFDEIINARYSFDPEYWTDVSDEAKDFIRRLLVVDPALRMSADQALAHAWIKRAPKKSRPGMAQEPRPESVMSTDSDLAFATINLVPTMRRGAQDKMGGAQRFKAAVNKLMAVQRIQKSLPDLVAAEAAAAAVEEGGEAPAPPTLPHRE